MMKWFGVFPARYPYETTIERVDIPVGQPCVDCGEPISAHTRGFMIPHMDQQGVEDKPWHRRCFLQAVLGPDYNKLIERE